MIWVTWRQHRGEAVIGGAVLILLAVALVLTGRDMYAAYQQVQHGTNVATCATRHLQDPTCDALTSDFRMRFGDYSVTLLLLALLPALAGMFLGAPLLAREVEQGTHRFVWTQSITRQRWLTVKVGVLAAATLLAFAGLSALIMWWRIPLDQATGSQFSYGFDLEGVAPVAYALFALALGIAAGAVIHRTVAAMAVTLAGFALLRGVIEFVLRPGYQPGVSIVTDPSQGNPRAYNGDWVLSNAFHYVDKQGHTISFGDAVNMCQSVAKGGAYNFNACIQEHGVHFVNVYQPADRFWLFQGIESALFCGAALLLLAIAFWWVQRRLS